MMKTRQEPQVRGVVLLAFLTAFRNLNLLADDDVQAFLQGVQPHGWYPYAKHRQVLDLIEKEYPLAEPIRERVGMEFINTIHGYSEWQTFFASGVQFLRTHEASRLYYTFVQGDPRDIGHFTLVELHEPEGTAVIHSTTPFSKDLERGILLQGLRVTESFDYIDVDNTHDEQCYRVTFCAATHASTASLSTITAQEVCDAQHVSVDRQLAGAELQKVFWRYKQLEKDLARQQAFWESTNQALSKAFIRQRTQERELQEKHQQLAQAHATSELLKAGIIDAVPDAIITINEASEIVEFSAGAERIFGYRRAEVLGRSLSQVIIPPHLRQRHTDGMQRYAATGEARLLGQRSETEGMRADGMVFPVELTIAEVHLATQRLFTAYVRDITERQRMERALRESEQRFRSLTEVHPVPIGIVDRDRVRFLYVSPGLAELAGYAVDDLLATSPEQLFADPTERREMLQRLRHTGIVAGYEFTLRRADGSTIPAGLTAKSVMYEGVNATVGALVDLTERKRIETALAQQREVGYQNEKLSALGSLLAGVAHELNNPLAIVIGRAIMLEEEALDPQTATAISRIRQAAERCTRIVKTFLAMARQQQPERAQVNLNDLLTAALELLSYGLRTAGIEVRLDLASKLPEFLADAGQLHQVVSNLLINAQQALLEVPEPRWLHLATSWERAANVVRMTVTDNGPGVPEAIRSRIFDPFFTTKDVSSGMGVGLSLSHGLIAAHGGTLTLENPQEGGARFIVTLPLLPTEPSPSQETPQAEPSTALCTVLIVDDEPDFTELLSRILRRVGHQTAVAHSGNEALALLTERDYDIILSDLHMPDLNGPDFYRRLQTTHPHLLERIAFITGDTLGDAARRFLMETKRPYLEKPCSPAEIRRLVQQLLG